MERYLIVENGIITNVIVADEDTAKTLGAFPDYIGADIDMPYAPPIVDLQADMAELLIDLTYRTTLLELGVSI